MATLALAEALDRSQISSRLVQKLRFAWWTGEEIGLLGSTYYVKDLKKNSPAELNAHLLTIDTDMIASSNYVRGLWDASQLEDKKLAHACGLIQDVFKQHFNSKNLDTTPFYFNGRSDFAPFMDEGIPSGGVITGEDEIKTIEGAASFGGVVGMVLDPCYHQDCDRVETLSAGPARDILVQNLDALSFVLQYFATHSSLVSSLWN